MMQNICKHFFSALLWLVFAFAGQTAFAQDQAPNKPPCTLTRLASLDIITLPTGRVAVPVVIAGETYNFILSLGNASAVTDALATKLKLSRGTDDGWNGPIISVLGLPAYNVVEVPDLQIGSAHSKSVEMYVVGTRFVGPAFTLPEGDAVGGILGASLLRNFGVELDFKSKKLNLYAPSECGMSTVFWANSAAIVPFKFDQIGNIVFHMQLDGKDISVMPDLSSGPARMGTVAAESIFGIREGSPGFEPVSSGNEKLYRYPFQSLGVDGLAIGHPNIVIFPDKDSQQCRGKERGFWVCWGGSDLRIKLPEMRALHMFFSFVEMKMFVTGADDHR